MKQRSFIRSALLVKKAAMARSAGAPSPTAREALQQLVCRQLAHTPAAPPVRSTGQQTEGEQRHAAAAQSKDATHLKVWLWCIAHGSSAEKKEASSCAWSSGA